MTRKSQGQGKSTQACPEEFSNTEKGITLGYCQIFADLLQECNTEFFFPGAISHQYIHTPLYELYPELPALELARFPRGQNPAEDTERELFRIN